jgi:hypothetical protein
MQSMPDPEFSELSHDELLSRLAQLTRRLTLYDATERVARIGHYVWNRVRDRQGNVQCQT